MDHCNISIYRQRLRSASSHEVSVPRHRLSTYGRRAFAIVGLTSGTLYEVEAPTID